MSAKMTNSHFDGLWQRALNNAGDANDAKALADEALRARTVETAQAETIRALASQVEADLLASHSRHSGKIAPFDCKDGRCLRLAELLRLTERTP